MNPGGMMASHEGTKARSIAAIEKRLKFIAPLRNERTDATSGHTDYLGLENIQSWTGKLLPNANSDTSERDDSVGGTANVFHSGDVLFGKLRPYLAKALHADKEGVCSTELLVLKPQPDIHPRFLLYSMLSPEFIGQVDASTFGAKMPRANWEFIGSIKLPIPAYETQRLIADYLDRETARIDALVAEKEKMLALLEEKRAALISRAVTRGLDPNAPLKPSGLDWLGDIPAHWEVLRLKYLAEVRGGLTLGKKYSRNNLVEFAYLRVANVQDGYLKLDDLQTVEVPPEEAENYLLQYGDVLMNEGGDIDKLGRGCVWREEIKPCLHQNHVFSVRPHLIDPEWLALWTSTLEAKRYFEQQAKRSTNLASISGTNIKELPIPMPSSDEQIKIKKYIEGSTEKISAIKLEMQQSIDLLKERRAALITAAVTGQISIEEMSP